MGGSMPGDITPFSSRGPSVLSNEYIPDIMAPGENIRSAVPGGNYEYWSGTSMAGPHTTALVGLMWSANSGLRGLVPETMEIIAETAVPLTGQTGSTCGGDYTDGPNNDWGHGTIDALAAVNTAMAYGDPGTLTGTVTDASTTNPLEGATVKAALNADLIRQRQTDANGLYSMLIFSGTYTVTAQLYGYLPTTVPGVQITSFTTTTLDMALAPAPMYTVSGTVTDVNTGWPLYARLDITGYPYGPVWTDPATGQ
jgi:subtilisin family serine protease